MEFVKIDGDFMEGGGSIVRLSVAFSAITKKPIIVDNIRAKRENPGLKTQHLEAIKSVKRLCSGELKGDMLNSTKIEFIPNEITKRQIKIQIDTCGSIGLVLQCLFLPAFFSKKRTVVEIKGGGTMGLNAPNLLYTKNVFLPLLNKMGFNAEINIQKHGFYPKGGADVIVTIEPVKEIIPLNLIERGKLKCIKGVSIASSELKKSSVAERQTAAAKRILGKKYLEPVTMEEFYFDTNSIGSGILLIAEFENTIIAWDALGERGKSSDIVGMEAAHGLIKQLMSDATIDDYAIDQLIPYMALCSKESKIKFNELTLHSKTNLELLKKFIDFEYLIDGNELRIKKLNLGKSSKS